MNKTVTEIIDEVCEEICRSYCKHIEAAEEMLETKGELPAVCIKCPLNELR